MRNVAMRLNPTNTQTAHEGLPTGASNAAKMQTITSCLPNQVGIFYGCQGSGCLNQPHPAKSRQAPKPRKRVSFKRTSPLTNVFVKLNEQCRACSNIVMARKRTFRGTREERLAWHLYQLVIIQGVVCPPKFQVLCA